MGLRVLEHMCFLEMLLHSTKKAEAGASLEFKATLVYVVGSSTARTKWRDPESKLNNKMLLQLIILIVC